MKILAQAIFIVVNVDSGVCVCTRVCAHVRTCVCSYPSIILTTIGYPFETVTFGVRS